MSKGGARRVGRHGLPLGAGRLGGAGSRREGVSCVFRIDNTGWASSHRKIEFL